VETWEWNQVDGELTEIRVELTWETEASRGARHDEGHKVVKITVVWSGELKSTEADVVQGLVIDAEGLLGVLNKLVNGESSVVWLNNGIGHLWGWNHGVGGDHAIWVLLTDLGDQECSETGTSTTTEGVDKLETLSAVARLSLLTDDIEDGVNELSTFGVVTLGPVVTGTRLAENEVVWAEELTESTGAHGVHGSWLKIDENGTWNEATTGGLVVVDVHTFELEIGVAFVRTSGGDAVFVGDDFPELGTDLVTALTGLDVDDFTHCVSE
jgi:hypothetical protein